MLIKDLFAGTWPQAVFFDLDGTLVDSVPDLAAAVDGMLLESGFSKAGEAKVRTWVGNGAKVLVERALKDARQTAEISESELADAHQLFVTQYHATEHAHSRLYDGVIPCLDALRSAGVPMVVITNKPGAFTPTILAQLDIQSYFSEVLSGDSLPEKKPSPLPLKTAADRLNVPLNQCLMVGDSRNDVIAAENAGVRSVCVSYGYNHGEPVTDLPASMFVDRLDALIV